MLWTSQYGQDIFISGLFRGKRNGVFVDIGAYDGYYWSNTHFFEKQLGWTGLCVEPNKNLIPKLIQNRSCQIENALVYNKDGEMEFTVNKDEDFMSGTPQNFPRTQREYLKNSEVYKVKSYNINTLLEKYGLYDIDYLSIDTEGSESLIIQSIDLKKFNIKCISAEANELGQLEIMQYLTDNGYKYVMKCGQDMIFYKDIENYFLSPMYQLVATKLFIGEKEFYI